MIAPQCNKNCCKVGDILFNSNVDHPDDAIELYENELTSYDAFVEMYDECYHVVYMLAIYCVRVDHIECLRYITKHLDCTYPAGLACAAAEHDNLKCLKFIMEELGNVAVPDPAYVGINCVQYVLEFKNKNPNVDFIEKIYN